MNTVTRTAAAIALTAGVAVSGAVVANPAAAAPQYKLNGTDARFLRSNEQVNLAETTIGRIEFRRATGPAAINLARQTVRDHLSAGEANTALARSIGVGEPTQPDAMQQKVAAFLMHAVRVNREYFVAQIAGHEQSIAATRYEIGHGIRPRVRAYAKYYLPVAESHLRMASRDLRVWTRLNS